jgi:pimeloyl-ACP methyl ester carboxylesterase
MTRTHQPSAAADAPRLRRAYFESRFGQLHVHNAIPAGGGFDEATTLLCVHSKTTTGRVFGAVLPLLGVTRSVYAPDLPGRGESDGPSGETPAAQAAEGMLDFIDSMRFRQLDVLGAGSGAAIAIELALERPQVVRRVVLLDPDAQLRDERRRLVKQPVLVAKVGVDQLQSAPQLVFDQLSALLR